MSDPSDMAHELIESVRAELREAAGKSWVDPFRIHLDLKAKMRNDSVITQATVTVFMDEVTIVVTRDFSGQKRIRSTRR